MKRIATSFFFAALCHSTVSNDEADNINNIAVIPKLRISKTGVDKINDIPTLIAEQHRSQTKMSSRERMDSYIKEKQAFMIFESGVSVSLHEAPNSMDEIISTSYATKGDDNAADALGDSTVKWFCSPTYATPDSDGNYDSIVARSVTLMSESFVKRLKATGATGFDGSKGKWHVQGYTASYNNESGYYNEVLVDFDDTTVWQIRGSSIQGYETSPAGGKGGMVVSGKVTWTFDKTHPAVQRLANELGMDPTAELCDQKYAEVWTANNNVVYPLPSDE